RDWHGTADRAEAIERDSAAALTVIERRKVGGLRKEYAQKIEQRAAEIFECHTGKSATLNVRSSDHQSYGPYLEFVKSLFEILEVNASAESVIRTRTRKSR